MWTFVCVWILSSGVRRCSRGLLIWWWFQSCQNLFLLIFICCRQCHKRHDIFSRTIHWISNKLYNTPLGFMDKSFFLKKSTTGFSSSFTISCKGDVSFGIVPINLHFFFFYFTVPYLSMDIAKKKNSEKCRCYYCDNLHIWGNAETQFKEIYVVFR